MNPIRTSNEIGAAIRTERKRQGLTQTDLADLCGVSLTFISNLETGKPTAELAKALTVLITLGLDVYLAKRGE